MLQGQSFEFFSQRHLDLGHALLPLVATATARRGPLRAAARDTRLELELRGGERVEQLLVLRLERGVVLPRCKRANDECELKEMKEGIEKKKLKRRN